MKIKSIILAAAVLLSFGAANAQDDFGQGKWSVELQMTPNVTGGNWFTFEQIELNYTLGNKDQVFTYIGINTERTNDRSDLMVPNALNYATDALYNSAMDAYNHHKNDYSKEFVGDFWIAGGYQHYFITEGRFRPFANAAIGVEFGWGRQKVHTENYDFVNDEWYTEDLVVRGATGVNMSTMSYTPQRFFSFWIEACAGFDFYLYKGLYVGTEFGVVHGGSWAGDCSANFTTTHSTATDKSIDYEVDRNASGVSIYEWINPTITIGWHF